ncbi:ATP-grasp domain-containing protein [Actinomadura macra]|uniref:ATP-grasp domain-containing protein n=1 Tax=Actinomadura macra TaxID=46164 RepID=UPI00083263AB|nr:ATP-grasp domain-containing protein [Actinomadura macra]
MSRPALVLVESNTTGTGRLFPVAARELGLRPVLLSADPGRYGFGGEVEVVRAATSSTAAVVTACRRLAPVAGVVSSSEYYIGTAAEAAAELGLPGNPAAAVRAARDKGEQRRTLAAGGVSVPRFTVASTPAAAVKAAIELGGPVVVKPVAGSGSAGVLLCADADEVAGHATTLLAMTGNERGLPMPGRILVERFVSGPEYSVEVFDGRAVGVVRKHLGPAPTFVETGHDFPAELEPRTRRRVVATALTAVWLLGLRLGPAHVEVRVERGEPVLIEVNPRLAGGWIPRLLREALGIDLVRETVRVFSGGQAILAPTACGAAAIRFVLVPGGGILADLSGLDAAREVDGILDVRAYREPGAELVRHGDFRDRLGHVLAAAPTLSRAADAAARSVRLIRPVLRAAEETPA